MRQKAFTKEQELQINEEYALGMSSIALAKKHNVDPTTVVKAIRSSGGKMRTTGEVKRKYTYNHSFFKNIDTEAKAYFLGLILADGCVRGNVLEIGLQRGDRHILESFIDCIDGNNSIQDYMWRAGGFSKGTSPCSRLTITSAEMVNDLRRHGIVDRKTYNVYVPKIETYLQKHFWRGVWDGDGSISFYTSKRKRECKNGNLKVYINKVIEVGLYGHVNTCTSFSEFLIANDIQRSRFSPHYSIFMVRVKTKDCPKFLNLIYTDSDPKLCLKRKYEKYQEYLEYKKVNGKSKEQL